VSADMNVEKEALTWVVMAGNIGSGKTSLTQLLSQRLGWQAFYESVDNNPYLADFYADMRIWAFHLQMYFLGNRAHEIEYMIETGEAALMDRSIYEDAHIFVRALHEMDNLSERDFQAYTKLYSLVLDKLQKPSLLVYLDAPVSTLVDRIQKRARSIEDSIDPNYLRLLDSFYKQWIPTYSESPLLTINSENYDFVNNLEHLEEIIKAVDYCIKTRKNLVLNAPGNFSYDFAK